MKAAILAVLLALAPITTSESSAQNQPVAPQGVPTEMKVPPARPLEKGTYFGASVVSVSNALRGQLQISRGMGLAIMEIRPGSPAARAGLLPHDVLVKLDDQILINPGQFVVLVRNKRPGNRIDLTMIRQGKPLQLEVTLGEAMMPTIEDEAAMATHFGGKPSVMQGGQVYDSTVYGEMANASEITFRDELYDIAVKVDASALPLKKSVVVKSVESGQVVFQGNINTPEERAAVRSEIVDRLKQMKVW